MTIDLDTARTHLKADGDDDQLVTKYLAGAKAICEGFCNRKFYDTQEEADDDFTAAMTDLSDAQTARSELLATATTYFTVNVIKGRYFGIIGRIMQRVNGMVADDLVDAAILVTLGFLYYNREDAPAVPQRAQRILQPYLWIGDLADETQGAYYG